jgi:hypothetical protein
MIYQLPNGKVIEITIEQFLRMTDEDMQYMIANNFGEEINNPFFDSVLNTFEHNNEELIEEIGLDELTEEDKEELQSYLDEDYDIEEDYNED